MAKSHERNPSYNINNNKHDINKKDRYKINYKVILPSEFGINLLTPSKNRARYSAENKQATHNRVKEVTAHNRMVEAEMTLGAIASLSL